MRLASVRRTSVLHVSPITTYGGLPQDGQNLPQDGQRSPQNGRGSPTRRSAPPLSSPLLLPIPCSLLCAPFPDVPHRACSSCTIPSTKTHQIGAKSGYFSFITTGAISSYVMMKFRSQSNQEITRKRVYKMQTVYGQSSSKLNPQTRKIATIAIVLFALS